MGGDEFVVVLPSVGLVADEERGAEAARRGAPADDDLRRGRDAHDQHRYRAIGQDRTARQIVDAADQGALQAKRDGKNRTAAEPDETGPTPPTTKQ